MSSRLIGHHEMRTRLGDTVRTVIAQRLDGSTVEQITITGEEPLTLAPAPCRPNALHEHRARHLTRA